MHSFPSSSSLPPDGFGEPIFFGPSEARLFGWYLEPPPGVVRRGRAVLISNPFGYEALCIHRTYRVLAHMLAARGLAVLRYDHVGTGDSSGDDLAPGLVRFWINGLAVAAEQLKVWSGAEEIAVVGVRLGATLALSAAERMPELESVVAWAAFRTAKDVVREARAFRRLKGLPAPQTGGEGAEEAAGYLLSADTCRELTEIDLSLLTRRPARRALLLSRDDIADDGRLATALTALGVAVTSETPPGYIAMMQDAFDSVVPEQALIRIADYLELGASVVSSGPLKCIYECITNLDSHGIAAHEQVLRFGPGNRLFGVATVPSAPVPGAPTILLLNTGSNHHVGPNRLHVKMARRFAAAGFRVLRFDISGIGDSPIRPGGSENNVYATQSVDDVRFAMDAEQARTGASSFALFGICSGACVAFNGAVTDPRVVAQVLVNLLVFHFPVGVKLLHSRTAGKSTLYYKSKISQFETWGRLVRGQVNLRWIARALSRRGWDWACHHISCIKSLLFTGRYRYSDVEHRFLDLCNRGTRSLLIFSFDDNGIDVVDQYLGAGASRMRHQANFHLEIISNVDHTFTPIWSHDLLIDKVLIFLCDKSVYSEARGSRHQSISVSSGS